MNAIIVDVRMQQEDIDTGRPCDGGNCPTTGAIRRALGVSPFHIWTARLEARLYEAGVLRYVANIPYKATAFIERYDGGMKVSPIGPFTLEFRQVLLIEGRGESWK